MSEVLNAPFGAQEGAIGNRKLVRKAGLEDSSDEMEEGAVGGTNGDPFQGERTRCQRRHKEVRSRRRLPTSGSEDNATGSSKGFHITCFVCKCKVSCSDASSSLPAYYICDKCQDKQEHHVNVEAALGNSAHHPPPSGDSKREYSCVNCPNCARRLELAEAKEDRDMEFLQSCWHDLRQIVRHMFRDGLTQTFTSLKGKPIDVSKVKRNVAILASKDPHQLYKRLESISHEYVMSLKSDDLWQILVVPQVVPSLIKLFDSGASEDKLELERAKLFIKSLLDRFSSQQETVSNMSPLLATLDEDYLRQFGINWKIINHHIFDMVIYQDDLLLNYLPSMEKVLKCELILAEESGEEKKAREIREKGRLDLPSGALELAQSFRVFHNLMITSRVIFDKASENIALYVEQQCMIHDMRKSAKVELVEEDLEFFKSQRKMMRNWASNKHYRWREDLPWQGNIERLLNTDEYCSFEPLENTDSEADAAEFSKRLQRLMDEAPAACIDENGKLAPSMECKECSVRHCSCDECRISHVITCGLLCQDDGLTTDLGENKSSTDVSESNEKESDSETQVQEQTQEQEHKCTKSPTCPRPKSPCVQQRSLRFQAARALFTLHDHYNKKEIAWGDWQAPYSLPHDLDLGEHCLNDTHTCPHSELFEKNARFDKDGFVESEAFVAAIKDVAEQIGYDIQETVIGKARRNKTSWDLYDVTKFGLELNRELRAQIKSHLSSLMKSKSCGEEAPNGTSTVKKDDRSKERLRSASCRVSCSTKQRTQKWCGCAKATTKPGHVKTASSSDSRSDSDSESSPSLAGTADWSQIKLHNDAVVNSALFSLKECCDKAPLCEADRRKLHEMAQRELEALTRGEPTVGELALELSGNKTMVKPQLVSKTPPTCSVTRVIRKQRPPNDKTDSPSNNACAAAVPKPLTASTKEKMGSRVRDSHRKGIKVLNLPASYRGDMWTAQHDCKQMRRTKAMVEVSAKQGFMPDTPSDPDSNAEESTKEGRWSGIAVAKFAAKAPPTDDFFASHPSCLHETDSTRKASAMDKVSKGTATSCHARSTASCGTQSTDTGSLSTTVDFNVDLNDMDLRTFSSEMAKKLREGGKLDKLIAQAVGMGATKMALSGKLEYKCEEGVGRRMTASEAKEEFMNYSDDDADDMTDDEDEDSAEWSECEAVDQAAAHPHRHHSCDNKKKEAGGRKDNRGMHCDCCYCEMFGHSVVESGKLGRAPQMRERLRQKLNRRIDQESKSKSGVRQDKREVAEEGWGQEETEDVKLLSVDEILEFINQKDTAAAQAAASKAAKRVRKKQRKQEDKERVEMERQKQEEARRLKKEEEERLKKERQAAQQAASKEKALKAEEKRRQAAEDRARAHKRQKELREQERLKEQQRALEAQAARQAAQDAKEQARKAKAEQEALRKSSIQEAMRRAKVEEAVRKAKAEQLKLERDEEAARRQRLEAASKKELQERAVREWRLHEDKVRNERIQHEQFKKEQLEQQAACWEKMQQLTADRDKLGEGLRKTAKKVVGKERASHLAESTSKVVPMKMPSDMLFEPWQGEQMPATKGSSQKSHSIQCTPLPAVTTEPRPPSAPSRMDESSQTSPQKTDPLPTTRFYDRDTRVLPLMCMHTVHPTSVDSQSLFDAFTTPPPGFAPRPLSAQAKSIYCPQMDYAGALPPAPFSYVPFEANPYLYSNNAPYYPPPPPPPRSLSPLSTLTQPQSAFEMPVHHADPTPQSCKQFNGICLTTPCSSSSSTPAASSFPYGGVPVIRPGFVPTPMHHTEPRALHCGSTVFPPPPDVYPFQTQAAALLNFNQQPTNTAHMSSASMGTHKPATTNPMAIYESETRVLAAVLEQENALATARHPMVYEPGDPRIATAIASINNDPHDTFKPRPDTELQFLDSTEQEIERFKRVMWETRSDTWSRLPSGNLPGIDPENEENAVFHFDPLV